MGKKKKVNPNRRPATHADVNRAKKQATQTAMRRLLYIVLFILIDKHGAPEEDIHQLAAEINSTTPTALPRAISPGRTWSGWSWRSTT